MIESKNITYNLLNGNIHQIMLHNNTRQTVDDLFAQVTEINKSAKHDEPVQYLFDSGHVNDLPFRYVIQLSEKWRNEQENVAPARNAVLYTTNMMMRYMVNVLVDVSKKSGAQSRIFSPNERDEAIAWLKSNT